MGSLPSCRRPGLEVGAVGYFYYHSLRSHAKLLVFCLNHLKIEPTQFFPEALSAINEVHGDPKELIRQWIAAHGLEKFLGLMSVEWLTFVAPIIGLDKVTTSNNFSLSVDGLLVSRPV
jgi:hypothetical protein